MGSRKFEEGETFLALWYTTLEGRDRHRRGGLCPQSGMISLKGGDSVHHDDTYINPH